MGWASRHRWDMRVVEYFRVMKLDGPEAAERYRAVFHKQHEFETALTRVMARVNYMKEHNGPTGNEASIAGGFTDGNAPNAGGTKAPVENAGPISEQSA